jgi:hypothetical protein
METRTYNDLFDSISALCGVVFAPNEQGRIKVLANRRATKAFRSSNYWPRFLVVGEERDVVAGIVPWEQNGLDSVDTFLRIHRTQPFVSNSAQEYSLIVVAAGARLVAGPDAPSSAWVTYKRIHNATYGDGGGDTAQVPKEWFEFMAHGTYADWLRAEGQQEKAALADMEAVDLLSDELLRIDEMTTIQNVAQRISTNLNSQNR